MGGRMKYEKPAEGIMKVYESDTTKIYSIPCSCMNDVHSILMEVESDEFGEIMVHFYSTQSTPCGRWEKLADWDTYKIDNPILYFFANSTKEFINGLSHRLKITKEVWFTGQIKSESVTILTKQQALNFAETLKVAIKDFEG